MSKQIERLRYYDGEYLRSYDFTDEQKYRIEMRRRLNHKLHLRGIVNGLHLLPDQDSPLPPAFPFFSIEPGMALDHSGREIFVTAPYSLSAENVLNRPGLTSGEYELWLCYRETQTGLPAAGYRDCNEKNQQTRWQETFQVVLKPLDPTPDSYIPPDCGGVMLGTITVDGNQISAVNDKSLNGKPLRKYVGIRAQRVVAADELPDTFDITALPAATKVPNQLLPGYLDVHLGIFSNANLITKKNVVIGDDFSLDANDPNGKNLPKNIPSSGNLKVTSDLFLNGDFYGAVGGKWFLLKDYIQTLMPDTVIGTSSIVIPQSASITDKIDVPVHTKLPMVTGKKAVLSISEIDWRDSAELPNFQNKGPITISVDPTISDKGGGDYNLAIQWTVQPSANFAGGDRLPVTKLVVSYVVVFQP